MLDINYLGIFVDNEEFKGSLKKEIRHKHMTIKYKPCLEDIESIQDYLGEKVILKVIGYGNDGINEGLKVAIGDSKKKHESIMNVIDEEKKGKLHITLSLSENGKAVDTSELKFDDFKEKDQYEIQGTIGVFCSNDEIVTDKEKILLLASRTLKSESKLIIPFYTNQQKINKIQPKNEEWKKISDIETRYLALYIHEIFNGDTNLVGVYRRDLYKTVTFSLKDTDNNSTEKSFSLYDEEVYHFCTGIGFFVFSLGYDLNMDEGYIDALANLGYICKEFDQADMKNAKDYIFDNNYIKSAIYSYFGDSKPTLFPSTSNQKSTMFHRVLFMNDEKNNQIEKTKKDIALLMLGLKKNTVINNTEMEEFEHISDNLINAISPVNTVIASMVNAKEKNGFLLSVHPKNVNNYYFLLYILTLHKREMYMHLNYETVREKNYKKIKECLINYKLWGAYNTVSTESNYQKFYEKLYQRMDIESLENDVDQTVERITEHNKSKREKFMNVVTFVIAIMAIVSIIADFSGCMETLNAFLTFLKSLIG